jgi:hypothetical protein
MGQKRPAVGPVRERDARIYHRLAAWARCQRYRRVRQHTVHHWVSAGLLPGATSIPTGYGQRTTVLHVDTGRQLVALCRYRYTDELGRYDLIGAQLWLDGFDVATRFVTEALRREFGATRRDHEREEIGDSYLIARQRPIIEAMPHLTYDEREEVVDEVASAIEDGEVPSTHGLETIGKAVGVTPKEAGQLVELLPGLAPDAVKVVIEASDRDLLAARDAFTYLSARVTPDPHRRGRTRAKVRLGLFLSAFFLDTAARTRDAEEGRAAFDLEAVHARSAFGQGSAIRGLRA